MQDLFDITLAQSLKSVIIRNIKTLEVLMNKKGFTLAEVLITISIIGIVAALTMPVLTASTRKKEVTARLSKFNSIMEQAITMSERDNGPVNWWSKTAMQYDQNSTYDPAANSDLSDAFFKKYLASYLKYISAEKDSTYNNYTKVVFADGSVMHVRNGGCYDLIYDINGGRKPNVMGRDKFAFLICPGQNNSNPTAYFQPGVYFGPYAPKTNDRNTALNNCKTNKDYCGRILQMDNWEVKDDYPIRI